MRSKDHWDELLAEADWLQALARGLVRDASEADDLVQETWAAALRVEASALRAPRAWLRGTLRNLALRRTRSIGRREDHEGRSPRPGAAPSAEELTERAEAHEALLAAVGELAEPYRVPILLRYYEGLAPREIARELELPVRTVHTRLRRALEQLRERLDRTHPEGRKGWVLALFPGGLTSRAPRAGAGPALVALAGSGIVVGGALALGLALRTDPEPVERVPAPTTAAAADEEAPPGIEPPSPEGRTAVAAARDVPSETEHHEVLHGRVVDWEGRPVPGAVVESEVYRGLRVGAGGSIAVRSSGGRATTRVATTDEAGRFHAPLAEQAAIHRASSPGWLTVLAAVSTPATPATPGNDLRIVVAPHATLRGIVVDPSGQPIEGVLVTARIPETIDARFDRGLAGQHLESWRATTDAAGRFELPALADLAELLVELRSGDHATRSLSLAEARAGVIELHPVGTPRVHGYVVDENGHGLDGAFVALGTRCVQADEYGTFTLWSAEEPGGEILAVAPNRRPERLAVSTLDLAQEVPIVLGRTPLAIHGTVVDDAGRPLPGVDVWLADPCLLGGREEDVGLEAIAAGRADATVLQRTGPRGEFTLGGLEDRAYVLRALDPRTALWTETDPRHAGEPTTISLPTGSLSTLAGRVATRDGVPLAGAEVAVRAPAYDTGSGTIFFANGSRATADAQGRFALRDVPATGIEVRVTHPDVVAAVFTPDSRAPTGVDWRLSRSCRLRVLLADASPGTSIQLCDAEGRSLAMRRERAFYEHSVQRLPLVDGHSPVLIVPEEATELRVHAEGREPERIPLALKPGELVTLRR